MAKYPTRKEILFELEEFEKNGEYEGDILKALANWKYREYNRRWSKLNNAEKIISLRSLLYHISINRNDQSLRCDLKDQYCYNRKTKTISLDLNHPSILSTLHELGHHIHGSSELKACVFSIWYFKHFFPKEFHNLTWKGHLLVKKQYEETCPKTAKHSRISKNNT